MLARLEDVLYWTGYLLGGGCCCPLQHWGEGYCGLGTPYRPRFVVWLISHSVSLLPCGRPLPGICVGANLRALPSILSSSIRDTMLVTILVTI
jgi:hypothetical protein